jgi:hypothetical protein
MPDSGEGVTRRAVALLALCSPALSECETRGNRGHGPNHPGFAALNPGYAHLSITIRISRSGYVIRRRKGRRAAVSG